MVAAGPGPHRAQPQRGRAAGLSEESLADQRRAGNHLGTVAAIDGLGLHHQAQRNVARALRYFEEAVALRRGAGAQSGLGIALQRLGVLVGVAGDTGRAATLLSESLLLSMQMVNYLDIANILLSLGGTAAGMGQPVQAARLFGAGEALLAAKGLVVPEAYRSLYAHTVAGVRHVLGDEPFAAVRNAGALLPLEQAISEALSLAGSG